MRGFTRTRLVILLALMLIILAAQSTITAQSPTATPTPFRTATSTRTAVPSRTTIPPTAVVATDGTYFHPTGVFSFTHPAGWNLFLEKQFDPFDFYKISMAEAIFISNAESSIIQVDIEKDPDRRARTVQDLNILMESGYFFQAWGQYEGGWREIGRRIISNRVVVDFDLVTRATPYLGRLTARFDRGWLIVTRLVVPKDNPPLLARLDELVNGSLVFHYGVTSAPVLWPAIIDTTAGYLIKYPVEWKLDGQPGQPFVASGTLNGQAARLTTKAEPGKTVFNTQAATAWVTAQYPNAKVLAFKPEVRGSVSGLSVAYTDKDSSGSAVSQVATLLNGPNNTLYAAEISLAAANLNLLNDADKNVPPEITQMRGSFILIAKGERLPTPTVTPTQVVTRAPTRFVTRTPLPTRTAAPLPPLTMDNATTYKSEDGVIEMQLPSAMETRPVRQGTYQFYYGDPNRPRAGMSIIIGPADTLYQGVFGLRRVPESPKAALEAFKDSIPATVGVKITEPAPTKIGTLDAYGAILSIPATSVLAALETDIRIAVLPDNQIVITAAFSETPSISRIRPILNQMLDSLVINPPKLPTATAVSTLHPLLITATALQTEIRGLTPGARTRTPTRPAITRTPLSTTPAPRTPTFTPAVPTTAPLGTPATATAQPITVELPRWDVDITVSNDGQLMDIVETQVVRITGGTVRGGTRYWLTSVAIQSVTVSSGSDKTSLTHQAGSAPGTYTVDTAIGRTELLYTLPTPQNTGSTFTIQIVYRAVI
ncbi:MAG: hypothetical protein IT324_21925, partial [Anaerolineae bacterium]|nr:hypothetical protein [Anaerolineae bacterium]